jgi:hypothetical protein
MAFQSIDAVEPYTMAMDFQCVAVIDGGSADKRWLCGGLPGTAQYQRAS